MLAKPTLPPLRADDLAARLPAARVIGREVQVFAETGSTNDVVAHAGRLGAGEGLVVFAESQRAGRGRQGRAWASAPGLGLWFSVLLRPPPAETFPLWPQLAFWAALAVAESIEAETGLRAAIKWPNDVLLAGRKVAGILIETHGDCVVAGIGLNVHHCSEDFPAELRQRAGSLALLADRPPDRARLAAGLLTRLDALYAGWPANRCAINAACGERSHLRGRRVRTLGGDAGRIGTVTGFDEDGRLLLVTEPAGEPLAVSAGEVAEC